LLVKTSSKPIDIVLILGIMKINRTTIVLLFITSDWATSAPVHKFFRNRMRANVAEAASTTNGHSLQVLMPDPLSKATSHSFNAAQVSHPSKIAADNGPEGSETGSSLGPETSTSNVADGQSIGKKRGRRPKLAPTPSVLKSRAKSNRSYQRKKEKRAAITNDNYDPKDFDFGKGGRKVEEVVDPNLAQLRRARREAMQKYRGKKRAIKEGLKPTPYIAKGYRKTAAAYNPHTVLMRDYQERRKIKIAKAKEIVDRAKLIGTEKHVEQDTASSSTERDQAQTTIKGDQVKANKNVEMTADEAQRWLAKVEERKKKANERNARWRRMNRAKVRVQKSVQGRSIPNNGFDLNAEPPAPSSPESR
jgi:hypothetical protein